MANYYFLRTGDCLLQYLYRKVLSLGTDEIGGSLMTFPEGLDPTVIHEGLWHFLLLKAFL